MWYIVNDRCLNSAEIFGHTFCVDLMTMLQDGI